MLFRSLKEKIKDIHYDIIYSSPLTRAKHTAEIINSANKPILADDRLTERNPGNLTGQPLKVTNREEYWNYYSKIHYGTSERIVPFFNKVFDFIDSLKMADCSIRDSKTVKAKNIIYEVNQYELCRTQ